MTGPVGCPAVRESLSARLDGEVSPVPDAVVEGHLEHCGACAAHAASLARMHRSLRVGGAEAVPDLTDSIVAAADRLPTGGRSRARRTARLRVLVGAAGVAQMVLALSLVASTTGVGLHAGRDLAGLELALGVGFLFAAVQPWRAAGMLPVAAIVAAFAITAGAVDVVTGAATLASEVRHVTELGGLAGLTALWHSAPDRALRPVTAR